MARKVLAIAGTAIFLVSAPGFVAGLVPWWISHWRLNTFFSGLVPVRIAGSVLLALGVLGLIDSFARFALEGVGTPAPIFPTRRLVVTGLYRYVRNPMYLALVSTIIGQALVLGNVTLVEYADGVPAVVES
ncbi:MAG: methyltransferase family protein [Bryobacteraceae bacterium]